MAVVFSLQDETDLAKQKIDTTAVAADCQAQGVKHVRFATSDAGGAACWNLSLAGGGGCRCHRCHCLRL